MSLMDIKTMELTGKSTLLKKAKIMFGINLYNDNLYRDTKILSNWTPIQCL